MNILNKYIAIIGPCIILISCTGERKVTEAVISSDSNLRETKYYHMFTEATKHALFPNYKSAITLYEACINEYPEKAAPYYQLGIIYSRLNDFQRAVYYSGRACKLDTVNEWYKINLANIYQYLGRNDSAIVLYENLIKGRDDDEMKYNLALLYTQSGRNQQAIDLLNTISDINRESHEVILLKHNIFHGMMNYDSAVISLEDLISIFPDDINNYGILAEYLTEIGRVNYAKSVYNEMLRNDSLNGLVLLSYAEHYINANMIDSAFILFNKALCSSDLSKHEKIAVILAFISNKDFIKQYENRIVNLMNCFEKESRDFSFYAANADIYINLENYAKAKPFLDSALMFEKGNYLAWEQTLLINSTLNEDIEVVRIATEAISFFNDRPTLYLIKANSLRNLGMYDSAKVDINRVLDLDINKNTRVQAYNLLAEIYKETSDNVMSDKTFEEILLIDPENLMIRNNYAYYLSLRGDNLKRAEELSKYTIDTDPTNATYLDTYGWILFKAGKITEAKKYIEESIRNGAYTNVEVLEHYGDIMAELNRCEEAIEAYEAIRKLDEKINISDKIERVKQDCK